MRAKLIAYWITTGLITLELMAGGMTDLVHGRTVLFVGPPVIDVMHHLGYPVYLLTILGVAKLLAVPVLLSPGLPRLKEWAYAGTVFELTGAALSALAVGDALGDSAVTPGVFIALAIASWALRPQGRLLGILGPAWRPTRRDNHLDSVGRAPSLP